MGSAWHPFARQVRGGNLESRRQKAEGGRHSGKRKTACHSERSEESRPARTEAGIGARFLAEFTLSTQSEILRFAQDDSEGLGMTPDRVPR